MYTTWRDVKYLTFVSVLTFSMYMYNSGAIFELYIILYLCSLCTRNAMLRCWHLAVPVRENEQVLKLLLRRSRWRGIWALTLFYTPYCWLDLIAVVQTSVISQKHIVIRMGKIMRTPWDFWLLLFQTNPDDEPRNVYWFRVYLALWRR
jgi:hypothetical protein